MKIGHLPHKKRLGTSNPQKKNCSFLVSQLWPLNAIDGFNGNPPQNRDTSAFFAILLRNMGSNWSLSVEKNVGKHPNPPVVGPVVPNKKKNRWFSSHQSTTWVHGGLRFRNPHELQMGWNNPYKKGHFTPFAIYPNLPLYFRQFFLGGGPFHLIYKWVFFRPTSGALKVKNSQARSEISRRDVFPTKVLLGSTPTQHAIITKWVRLCWDSRSSKCNNPGGDDNACWVGRRSKELLQVTLFRHFQPAHINVYHFFFHQTLFFVSQFVSHPVFQDLRFEHQIFCKFQNSVWIKLDPVHVKPSLKKKTTPAARSAFYWCNNYQPTTVKNNGFGHLKTRLFTIKTSKNIGFGGPMVNFFYMYNIYILYPLKPTVCSWKLMLRRGSFYFWTAHSQREAASFRERKSSKPEKKKKNSTCKRKALMTSPFFCFTCFLFKWFRWYQATTHFKEVLVFCFNWKKESCLGSLEWCILKF